MAIEFLDVLLKGAFGGVGFGNGRPGVEGMLQGKAFLFKRFIKGLLDFEGLGLFH